MGSNKMKAYIYNKNDWDYEVIDVFLGLFNDADNVKDDVFIEPVEELHLKGFDDVEWQEAKEFAKMVSDATKVEYLGDRTNT